MPVNSSYRDRQLPGAVGGAHPRPGDRHPPARPWVVFGEVQQPTAIKEQPGGKRHTDNLTFNALITALRSPTERGNAFLGHWRALDRVTVCPRRIGVIAAAALVLISSFHSTADPGEKTSLCRSRGIASLARRS